ncbi:MAG TPA: MFS transporter [Candidatus Acidoferrales bacterium]|jgi:MFS family permease
MPTNLPSQLDSPRAWLVVIGAFLGAFVSFGVTYCFGVFLKPMSVEFHADHASMSVLFSVISGLTFFLAPFTGEFADHHGPRPVIAVGAVLMGVALNVTAHIHSFPLVVLVYGGGLGCAAACIYVPGVAAVGEWFKVRRDLALGVAISGIGCGTLVAAPVSAILIERYGWRESFIIFGWASSALLLLSAALMARPPVTRDETKERIGHKIRTSGFAFLYASLLFAGIAIYVAFVFVPDYAADIGVKGVAGAALIGYIGAASVVGRLGLDALAPRFGLFNMYRTAFFILLLGNMVWLTAHTYAVQVAFGIVMGVGYGGIAAMAPAVAANLFGVEGLGELLGILFTGFGAACLAGPPLAGAMIDQTHDFKWPAILAVTASLLGLALVMPLSAAKKPSSD